MNDHLPRSHRPRDSPDRPRCRGGRNGARTRAAEHAGIADAPGPRVSAEDYLQLYDHVLDLPAADRDLLLGALAAAPAVARDGFAQDFGLLAPGTATGAAADAVAKQGWMCCFSGRYYLHSAGLLGPGERFVVAVLSIQPRAGGWAQARDELDAVASAVGGVLTGAPGG
ncbi:hypothetical protein GCM10023215_50000 [Pseudonocardia yuanmonensis]|uniref:Uncharacterized protein n=1 Tax=Pseudonocardia yuanmonensis TaxID=1095914 RepID=A0ABP8XCZ4_9PSEU